MNEIDVGNPGVLPEYSYIFEAGLSHYFGQLAFIPEVYAGKYTNILDIYEDKFEYNGKPYPVSLRRFINAKDGNLAGFNFCISFNPFNNLGFEIMSSYLYYAYSYSSASISSYQYGVVLSTKIILPFVMVQGRVMYAGSSQRIWGKMGSQLFTELAFMTQIKNPILSLSAYDPFKIYSFGVYINAENYSAYKYNRLKWPYFRVSISYRVNKRFKEPKERKDYRIENTGKRFIGE